MHSKIELRLEALENEFANGNKILADMEKQQEHLRNKLLRISGAIQVLREILADKNLDEAANATIKSQEIPLPDNSGPGDS